MITDCRTRSCCKIINDFKVESHSIMKCIYIYIFHCDVQPKLSFSPEKNDPFKQECVGQSRCILKRNAPESVNYQLNVFTCIISQYILQGLKSQGYYELHYNDASLNNKTFE